MKQKQRVMKKFKRKSVVAPILIFVFILGITAIMEAAIITAEMAGILQKKIETAEEIGRLKLEDSIEELREGNVDVATALSDSECEVVVVKDGEFVYTSEADLQYNDLQLFSAQEDARLYLTDEDIKSVLEADHSIFRPSYDDERELTFSSADFMYWFGKVHKERQFDKKLMSIKAWVPVKEKLEVGELFVCSTIVIRFSDIAFSILSIVVSFMLILLVAIILVINIVTSVHSNNRMIQALYFDDKTLGNNWLYYKTKGEKLLRNRRNRYAMLAVQCQKYEHYCSCFGIEKADEVLVGIYDGLKKSLGRADLIARNADANFGIILKRKSEEELRAAVEQILKEAGEQIYVGVYFLPEEELAEEYREAEGQNIENLYHLAKVACDTIKESDVSEVAYFDEKIREDHMWEHKVENTMEQALADEEFVVYLQPKYDPKDSTLKGAEALIRWINPKEGFISPGRFIPIFEENGFITKIDDYMVSHVAKLQADWIAEGFDVVPVSVNISRVHFMDPNLAEHLCELVDAYHTPHEFIEFELTESAFFDDKKALLTTVDKLQNLGFHVSMDDFGSGYSSLNSLKDLPLNVLKLDAEFFRGETNEGRGEVIVGKAIELAKDLDMEIVAEGVEQKEQVEFLAGAGCDMIQGFYFDKPMPVEEYMSRMEKEKNYE